jgi:hypothetical protein
MSRAFRLNQHSSKNQQFPLTQPKTKKALKEFMMTTP